MAIEDLAKNATPEALMIGVGATVLARLLVPTVSAAFAPALKAVMRTGITLYRGAIEPVSAGFNNLLTEAQIELARGKSAQAAGARR